MTIEELEKENKKEVDIKLKEFEEILDERSKLESKVRYLFDQREHYERELKLWYISIEGWKEIFCNPHWIKWIRNVKCEISDIYKRLDGNSRYESLEWKFYFEKQLQKINRELRLLVQEEKGYDVDKAKRHPITSLIEFNRAGFTNCIFHNEKTPSLRYYPETNTCYCFGCGKGGDSIAIAMQLYNIKFKKAVKLLN